MAKIYIFGLEAGKELVDWFGLLRCDSCKEGEFNELYFKISSKAVCEGGKPVIYLTSIIKSRLENYFLDISTDNMEMLSECFFQGIKEEYIDGTLNANTSTIKQASLIDFLGIEYIVICKNEDLFQKLNEQNIQCVKLKDFKVE